MGQFLCCGRANSLSPTSIFLFQINRFIPKLNSSESNNLSNNINTDINNKNNLKENLNSEKGKYKFIFYDIK